MTLALRRAVFLDRDGVLNCSVVRAGKPYPPDRLEDVEILPGVPEGLARLKARGFLLIGATNQPDVGRGTQRREVVEAIHEQLMRELPLDEIYVCYEDREDAPGRKPNPGLLLDAAQKYGIDLSTSYMIGDRWRDVGAGQRAGCRTIFLDYGYAEKKPSPRADHSTDNFASAVDWLLTQERGEREAMKQVRDLSVKIYADGADKAGMLEMYRNPLIKGFTTNPTLMRKAGISDYEGFARDVLASITDRPLSLEVFSDDFAEMAQQARQIASWGPNVYVKIPVTNTRGASACPLIADLAKAGVKLNVTAIFTLSQVRDVCRALEGRAPAVVSVFAGRIADAGIDPIPMMRAAREMTREYDDIELLWASPREVLNLIQADEAGCDIITMSNDLLKKLESIGKDLRVFSLETVQMFRQDAVKAGYSLGQQTTRRAA